MPFCQLIVVNLAQICCQIVNIVMGNVLQMFNLVGHDSGCMQPSERAVASNAGQLPRGPPSQWATTADTFQLPMRPLLDRLRRQALLCSDRQINRLSLMEPPTRDQQKMAIGTRPVMTKEKQGWDQH